MKAKDILSHHQLKYSRQREALIELLHDEDYPMTIDQIVERLRDLKNPMNVSTVYRIVESLFEHQIVDKNYSSVSNSTLIQLKKSHHHHYLICQSCHKMIPLIDCPIHDIVHSIEDKQHFKVISHSLEIIGICYECQNKAQV